MQKRKLLFTSSLIVFSIINCFGALAGEPKIQPIVQLLQNICQLPNTSTVNSFSVIQKMALRAHELTPAQTVSLLVSVREALEIYIAANKHRPKLYMLALKYKRDLESVFAHAVEAHEIDKQPRIDAPISPQPTEVVEALAYVRDVRLRNLMLQSGSFSVTLNASDSIVQNYTLVLPTTAGTSNQLLTTNGSGNLFWSGPIDTTTAVNFSGTLDGDVVGEQKTTIVTSVGGLSAINVMRGASLANAATSNDVSNMIVLRDASGSFAAGTISVDGLLYLNGTNVTPEIQQGADIGVIRGGAITIGAVTSVNIAAGAGYLMVGTAPNDTLQYIVWTAQNIPLPLNIDSYLYIDNAGTVQSSIAPPDYLKTIILGKARTTSSGILYIQDSKRDATHVATRLTEISTIAFGPIYSTGSIVTQVAPNSLQLDVSSGLYVWADNTYMPSGSSPLTWQAFYSNGPGTWNIAVSNVIDYNHYNDIVVGTLVATAPGEFVKHELYIAGDGVDEVYLLVYGQEVFASAAAAIDGPNPLPPVTWSDNICPIASIVVENSVDPLQQIHIILDERPRIGFAASAFSTAINAVNFTGTLEGDVVGTQKATVVTSVGGLSAINVMLGASLANASTSGNIGGTIIRRNANGDFAAGTVTVDNLVLSPTTAGFGQIEQPSGIPLIHSYGSNNFFAGSMAGNFTLTGARNTAVGAGAGKLLAAASNTVALGYNAQATGPNATTNQIRIGFDATNSALETTCFIDGISGVTVGASSAVIINAAGQLGTVVSSKRYKKNIQDMGSVSHDIMQLRPVTFQYTEQTDMNNQYGLIAEEVAQVYPDLVVYKNGVPETVMYHQLPALLLNELQKHALIFNKYEKIIDNLLARIAHLESVGA